MLSLRACLSCHCEPASPVIASLRSNLSFSVCRLRKGEIASYLAMTKIFVIASAARQSLFFCLLAAEKRDRFVPRDDKRLSEPPLGVASLRSNLSFSVCRLWKSEIASFLAMTRIFVIASEAWQSLISVCRLWKGEIASYLVMTRIFVIASEAWQSLISVCRLWKGEIASYLVMTSVCQSPLGGLRACLSCHCEPASPVIASLRSNLSFSVVGS